MARAYNRNIAVETALTEFGNDPYYSNDCANFVSTVLAAAGIYDPQSNWERGSSWWIRSGDGEGNDEDLFHFLTRYFRFAEYNQGSNGRFSPRLEEGFQGWLRGLRGRIHKGDVVFYKKVDTDEVETIPAEWTHAAIVVDSYAPETGMYMPRTGSYKPRIVEHSGALNKYCDEHHDPFPYCRSEPPTSPGRSIDDTTSKMNAIAIVFMGEPIGLP